MIKIFSAPPEDPREFIWFNGVVITEGRPIPHAKMFPRTRLQEFDVYEGGVLFVFELSEVDVRCTKEQADQIMAHLLGRTLSAVRADEDPSEIQFRGIQPPAPPNRIGFSA
jgi:hypothetical protein